MKIFLSQINGFLSLLTKKNDIRNKEITKADFLWV